jgi:hypothetical protein
LLFALVLSWGIIYDLEKIKPTSAAWGVETKHTNNVTTAVFEGCVNSSSRAAQAKASSDHILLQARAHVLYAKSQQHAIPTEAEAPKVHYVVSRYHVSPSFSVSRPYHLVNLWNESEEWSDQACTQRVVCNASHRNDAHFAHFAEGAFPCWSVFQDFPDAQSVMEITPRSHGAWVNGLLGAFRKGGVQTKDLRPLSLNLTRTNTTPSCDWRAVQAPAFSAFPIYTQNKSFPVPSARYFEKREHMDALQKAVLGKDFREGPSRDSILRVLLHARQDATRRWVYTNETATLLNQEWNRNNHTLIDVHIRPGYKSVPFQQQALEMHQSDIIISPHGAQLTNLAFIRPCTAVLELFPKGYYLGYFQPYVVNAGGVSFEGYPFDRDRLADTQPTIISVQKRVRARKFPIFTSPESVAHAFSQLVLDVLTCRQGWDLEHR